MGQAAIIKIMIQEKNAMNNEFDIREKIALISGDITGSILNGNSVVNAITETDRQKSGFNRSGCIRLKSIFVYLRISIEITVFLSSTLKI